MSDDAKTWIDSDGIHVDDGKLMSGMERVTASATLVEEFLNGCPARYLFDSKLKKDIFPDGPDSPLPRGTAFHRVMELYYGLDESKRGPKLNGEVLNACARKALSEMPDMFSHDREFMTWLRKAIDDYMDMNSEYTDVDVAMYKVGHEYKPGLELGVSGYIGNAKRKTFGKIDRLTADGDGGAYIDDYKTGKKAKAYDPRDRFPEFGYVRQQTMYAMLLEDDAKQDNEGFRITGARLLYPIPNRVLNVDVSDEHIRAKTIKDVEKAAAMLDDAVNTNTYAFAPGKLCSWCPLVNICPKADKDDREKFVAARAKQPSAETLAPAVSRG